MNAIQLLEMKHNHTRMRESLRVRLEILREHLADETSSSDRTRTDFVLRELWGSTARILEQAKPLFDGESETVALLDEVAALNGRLEGLLL